MNMSIVKFNKKRRPWFRDGIAPWFDTEDFFADDFFEKESNLPAMNVKENDKDFKIELAVPGFSKKDIKVTMENDLLHVFAEKSKDETEENESGYTRREFSYNEFDRKLKLPAIVNQDKAVKATYKDGILSLSLAKNQKLKEPPKKLIEIS